MVIAVGQLASHKTLRTMYFYDLNYCHGSKEHRYDDERAREMAKSMFNGQFDGIYESNTYESFLRYYVGSDRNNEQACQRQLTSDQWDAFKFAIDADYHYRIYIDGLPAAVIVRDPVTGHVHKDYNEGIPVGKYVLDNTDVNNPVEKYILYNHFNFVVKTQPVP